MSHVFQHSDFGRNANDFVRAKQNLIDLLRHQLGIILNLAKQLVEQIKQLLDHAVRSDLVSFNHLDVFISLHREAAHLSRRGNASRHHRKR